MGTLAAAGAIGAVLFVERGVKRKSSSNGNSPVCMEYLEGRALLSGTGAPHFAPLIEPSVAHIATPAVTFKHTVYITRTALQLTQARVDLGTPVTLLARVTGGNGPIPIGSTVQFADGSKLLGTTTVSPTGHASLTLNNLYIGSHTFKAYLVGSTHYTASQSLATPFTVRAPGTTRLAGGLRTATVVRGTGTGSGTGDSITVNYTGFLTTGAQFDSSLSTGRSAFSFTLGKGQVIKGWDQGLLGIKLGETRDLFIPASLGYGSAAHSGIPANSELVFVVTRVASVGPTVSTAAHATPNPVAGNTTTLSALGASSKGETNLTYTWATLGTPPATVTFSANATNAAKNTTATFTAAGTYNFQVTISDGTNSVLSNVTVTVAATPTAVTISPSAPALAHGTQQQLTATATDQFGTALATQPSFTWTVTSGGGTVSASGLYTAPSTAGNAVVTATVGTVSGTANVTIT